MEGFVVGVGERKGGVEDEETGDDEVEETSTREALGAP